MRRHRHDADATRAEAEQAARRPGDGFAPDDDRGRVAHEPAAKSLAEARGGRALERLRELPRREVEERHDDRDAREHRRGARDGVVHGAGRAAPVRPPGRTQRRAAEEERIDRQGAAAQEARRRQEPPADDVELRECVRRVVEVGLQQEREGLARERVGVEGAEQPVEVARRGRCPGGVLEGTRVEDDADAWRTVPGLPARPGVGHQRRRSRRRRSSSQRSRRTTMSASTMIFRDIFDRPTRRSWNVIGTSVTRAPARLARWVISIWKT